MHFKEGYREFSRLTEYIQNFSLLIARIAVAYGFYVPSEIKWADPDKIAVWFASMGIPFPLFTTCYLRLIWSRSLRHPVLFCWHWDFLPA